MSFFSASAWVPKTAWTLLPTSMTPAAPEGLQPRLVDLALVGDLHPQPGDAGVDVDQVLPAAERGDQLLGLAVGAAGAVASRGRADPPAVTAVAEPAPSPRLAASSASNSSSGSRPGVRMFHFVIANRNRK